MWANQTNIEGMKHSFIPTTKWSLDNTNYTINKYLTLYLDREVL